MEGKNGFAAVERLFQKVFVVIKRLFKRYFIDAMGGMALGLFASLIIGTIIGQLFQLPLLAGAQTIIDTIPQISAATGAAIGVGVAWGMKVRPLVLFSSAATGTIGYALGGPIGAYLSAVVGAEFGQLVAGRTPIDIVVTPFVSIATGGLVGIFAGPGVNAFMQALGAFINTATELQPIPMGIVVSVVVGLALTAPISSAAICMSINISGIAAGAACIGCCCQMVGFAVASYRDNGVGGLFSQGLGTSMLQFPNIMRRPQIWIAPTLASAVLGPVSTAVLGMTNTSYGAGMGTSGLVGPLQAFDAMAGTHSGWTILLLVVVFYFLVPAVLTLAFDALMRRIGWVRAGDMKLQKL